MAIQTHQPTVEHILCITVRGDSDHYEGRIEDGNISPLTFDVTLHFPQDKLETLIRVAEAVRIPKETIARVVAQYVQHHHDLRIMRADGGSLPISAAVLNDALLDPIMLAIGVLKGKPGVREGTFRIPLLDQEDLDQFPDMDDLIRFVQGLNP